MLLKREHLMVLCELSVESFDNKSLLPKVYAHRSQLMRGKRRIMSKKKPHCDDILLLKMSLSCHHWAHPSLYIFGFINLKLNRIWCLRDSRSQDAGLGCAPARLLLCTTRCSTSLRTVCSQREMLD